jgi:hypothetical protein
MFKFNFMFYYTYNKQNVHFYISLHRHCILGYFGKQSDAIVWMYSVSAQGPLRALATTVKYYIVANIFIYFFILIFLYISKQHKCCKMTICYTRWHKQTEPSMR